MPNVVYKYRVQIEDETGVMVPYSVDAEVLHARLVPGYESVIEFWWQFYKPSIPETGKNVRVYIVGTGQPFPAAHRAVATVEADPYIWHLVRT